jgi:Calcineurin-like phosphoesterase superfamily domain
VSERTPKEIRHRARRDGAGRDMLTAHRGLATWGEKLVPLSAFQQATAAAGRRLTGAERQAEAERFLTLPPDRTPREGPYRKIAVFGGVYNNHYALTALLADAVARGAEAIYCLGDLGGFGPNPEKIWPLLTAGGVCSIQGNYEESLASGHEDCNCGYTDPHDNHYAGISYRYTAEHSSSEFKRWMGTLPRRRRVQVGARELLLVHGSPRRVNEFLFASTAAVPFLEVMLERERCDGMLCTHSGLQWHRRLPSGRDVINVGVIGRPANDGRTNVWYALLEAGDRALGVELVPLDYDYQALAAEMRQASLPEPFIDTVTSGWWTTCLEILPARERAASRF